MCWIWHDSWHRFRRWWWTRWVWIAVAHCRCIRCRFLNFRYDFVKCRIVVAALLLIIIVAANHFIIVIAILISLRTRKSENWLSEEREPSRHECDEVFESPRDRLNGIDSFTRCIIGIITIRADALKVCQSNAPENAILHQRVHNRSIDLPKKLSRMLGALRDENESIIVQQVAIELVRCARFLAVSGR